MKNSAKEKVSQPVSVCDEVLIAIRKIIQSIDLHSRYLVRQVGLTGPQLVILQELSKLGEVSVGELSKAISLSQATVTGILERLAKRGLITRRRSEIDRRRVLVQATQECEALLKNAPPLMQEAFIKRFENLQDWEQMMILSSLQRLVSMTDAKSLTAAPFLTTGPIEDPTGKVEKQNLKPEI
ncbi:MarR family winged helix-turn-helix transcriptional regulator [Desulfobacterales bacterium HSG2]|nr:MarR family winged helix-turn-helix transcriptional regulator [Desulfobacterales bacterium HSG2]